MRLHGISEGHGPPVVLLHAAGLDLASWDAVAAGLDSHFTVLRLDLRGHGKSPRATKEATITDLAGDVVEAMDECRIEKAAIVGISLGGMVAQTIAIAAPARVSSLVVCAAPPGIPESAREAMRARGLAAERGGMDAVIEPTIERWFTSGFRGSAAVDRVRERLRADDPGCWSATWNAIAGFDARPHLAAITAPTLVVAGSEDLATSAAASDSLAGAIPGARLVTIPGAPHMMQIETPDALVAALEAFLGGRGAGHP